MDRKRSPDVPRAIAMNRPACNCRAPNQTGRFGALPVIVTRAIPSMTFQGLSWRIGLPFLLLVVGATATLPVFTSLQLAAEERDRFANLAADNAAFISRTSLSIEAQVAEGLGDVIGFSCLFRTSKRLLPTNSDLAEPLLTLPADGVVRTLGSWEAVAVPIDGKSINGAGVDLIVLREQPALHWFDPIVIRTMLAFWGLAALLAWLGVRGLVRPLRSLAAKVPDIGALDAPEVPETRRNDEIGELARAFETARRALRDERQQRERMEKLAMLGQMTASLAHEIQNPVAAIRMHAQLLRGTDVGEAARTIERETSRIEDLMNQWMFLTRPEPPAFGDWDVGALAEDIVQSHDERLGHARVRVQVERAGDLRCRCDGKRLGHVFGNLLTNAIQAMPRGGDIQISVRGLRHTVEVEFRDGGPGFSPRALDRFGQFFFSEREGGMGIGLGVAEAIVRAHGGSMRAANAVGGGARVVVVLPRQGAEVAAALVEDAS